ncbi:hypothetical protein CMI37_27010 [Candidatus Pacearchaeota archaeon]|nr:hypothetical protein [Candidatus Pacearchaeota archaeon]|tara:strand:- start:4407 stop:4865 length:459 start_codon:yes stop_codon:yes gene_type:complete
MESAEKWAGFLGAAKEHFKVADHMAYVSLSILKENRMLIQIVAKLAESVRNLIKAFLHYEYHFKRIRLYRDPQMNLKVFSEKIGLKYLSKRDLENILKVLKIEKKHKEAPVEFVKKDTFVMLLGESYETLTIESVREFLNSVRVSLARFPCD